MKVRNINIPSFDLDITSSWNYILSTRSAENVTRIAGNRFETYLARELDARYLGNDNVFCKIFM